MLNQEEAKLALIIDEELPVGLIANTAAMLALTLSHAIADIIGPDAFDASGGRHVGITRMALPILRAKGERIKEIQASANEAGVYVVDFCDAAQSTSVYGEYSAKLLATTESELRYLGIAIYGAKRLVNRLTGSLPLLR